jgi:antitoxin (DNA-binding transcriptional repressor) of toxin-antitoxin stability system
MIGSMAALHISEADLARDLHAVLEQVRQGGEVVVEQDHRPVAIMKPAQQPGRLLSESIAIARQREKERGYAAVLDPDSAEDVEDIVRNRQLWNPTSWD